MTDSCPSSSRRQPTLAVPLAEAKNHLSALVARVEQGEEIAITRRGVPVVRLAQFWLIPRDSGAYAGQPPRIVPAPEGFVFHHLNAWEEASDAPEGSNNPQEATAPAPGQPARGALQARCVHLIRAPTAPPAPPDG